MSVRISHLQNKKEIVHFIIAAAFIFFFRFLPPIEPITPYGMAILGIFIGAIWGWCFSGINLLWTSFLTISALGLTLPAGTYGALSQIFGSYVFLIMLLGLFTVGALMGADIAEYLIAKVLSFRLLQGKPWLLLIVIFYGVYFISLLTNPMVIGIFMFSLYDTLFEQAGFHKGEKTPALIVISTAIILLAETIVYPWSAPQLISLSALEAGTGVGILYSQYIVLLLVFGIIFLALLLVFLRLLGLDVQKLVNIDLTFLQEKYAHGLSAHQKGVLMVMLVWVLGTIAISFYPPTFPFGMIITTKMTILGWMILMLSIMLFVQIDGKCLLDPQIMASSFPWALLLMIGVGVTLGTLVTSEGTGVAAWLSIILGPVLSSMNNIMLYIVLAIIGFVMTNLLNNNAVVVILSSTVVSLYTQGFIPNPVLAILVVIASTAFGFLTPASSMYGAMIHGQSFITGQSAYKYGTILVVFTFIAVIALLLPLAVLIVR